MALPYVTENKVLNNLSNSSVLYTHKLDVVFDLHNFGVNATAEWRIDVITPFSEKIESQQALADNAKYYKYKVGRVGVLYDTQTVTFWGFCSARQVVDVPFGDISVTAIQFINNGNPPILGLPIVALTSISDTVVKL